MTPTLSLFTARLGIAYWLGDTERSWCEMKVMMWDEGHDVRLMCEGFSGPNTIGLLNHHSIGGCVPDGLKHCRQRAANNKVNAGVKQVDHYLKSCVHPALLKIYNFCPGGASRMGWSIADKGHLTRWTQSWAGDSDTKSFYNASWNWILIGWHWKALGTAPWCEMKAMIFFRTGSFVQERALAY